MKFVDNPQCSKAGHDKIHFFMMKKKNASEEYQYDNCKDFRILGFTHFLRKMV